MYHVPVSDDGDDDVEHDEGAEEDEGHEVDVGDDGPALLLWVRDVQLAVLRVVPTVGAGVAGSTRHRRHHYVRPRLPRGTSETIFNNSPATPPPWNI